MYSYTVTSYTDWKQTETHLNRSHLLIVHVGRGLTRWHSLWWLKKNEKQLKGTLDYTGLDAYVKSILLDWSVNIYVWFSVNSWELFGKFLV